MTRLRIERMSATAADCPDPDRVPGMLRHVGSDRLESALRQNPLPEGDWCVRRLDVAVDLDPERPLSALETDWADRIVSALRICLRDGTSDVVRYLRPEQAVDDVLLGLATHRFDRAWAWRQVGLIEPSDPEPRSDPAATLLRVLTRLRQGRATAVARLIANAGVMSVHRLLSGPGWTTVATLVSAEAGVPWHPDDHGPVGQSPNADETPDPPQPLARALGGGALAHRLRGSAVRVDASTLSAWAVLVVAVADPVLLRTAPGALVMAVGEEIRPQAGAGLGAPNAGQAPARPLPTSTPAATPGRPAAPQRPTDPQRPAAPEPTVAREWVAAPGPRSEAGPQPTTDHAADLPVDAGVTARRETGPDERAPGATDLDAESVTTAWGGLLFLLNTAAAAGLPEVLAQPPLNDVPTPWVLHWLGHALVPLAVDDPALAALCTLPGEQVPGLVDDTQRLAVETIAQRWSSGTLQRLGPDPDPEVGDEARLWRLARRVAAVEREPGWVELRFRLDEVDLAVRRAGLDVDPGWVWWLGQVVRFRYE